MLLLRRHLLTLCCTLLGVLALLAAPAGAATAKPVTFTTKPKVDPVVVLLTKALKAREIAPLQYAKLRNSWITSARAAKKAPTAARRANIVATRTYVTNLIKRKQLTLDRVEPALLSVWATTTVMNSKRPFPGNESEVSLPGEPIVFTYYSGRGVQFQPFESFKHGMGFVNRPKPDVASARKVANRMLELGTRRGGMMNWEFFFPFNGPATPWTSSISQGLGTSFFALVASNTPELERGPYLGAADNIVKTFLKSTRTAGVASPQGAGSFYVMYSFNPGQRILNGHLQVLIASHRYWKSHSSSVAKQVYDRGYAAAVPLLPRFDTGEWSRYQLGQESNTNYHDFMMDQFKTLTRETKDPVFAAYYEKFRHYRHDPAELTLISDQWLSAWPAKDGLRDGVRIPFTLDKRAQVTLKVMNASGAEIDRAVVNARRGQNAVTWDGYTARGGMAAAGEYSGQLITVDRVGNRKQWHLPAKLVVERDTVAPQLVAATVGGSGASSVLKIKVLDAMSAYVSVKLVVGGRTVASGKTTAAGAATMRVAKPAAAVQAGTLVLTDTSGNVTKVGVSNATPSTVTAP